MHHIDVHGAVFESVSQGKCCSQKPRQGLTSVMKRAPLAIYLVPKIGQTSTALAPVAMLKPQFEGNKSQGGVDGDPSPLFPRSQ